MITAIVEILALITFGVFIAFGVLNATSLGFAIAMAAPFILLGATMALAIILERTA